MNKRPLIELAERASALRGGPAGRERILAMVFCGDVTVNGERCREPKRLFPQDSLIEIRGLAAGEAAPAARAGEREHAGSWSSGAPASNGSDSFKSPPPKPFVSRGGEKLDSVLEAWGVAVAGRVWLDAGCSTGGFTHCLLLRGAALVHAVDVGYNQLDWRLRNHPGVAVHERTNIMGLESLEPPAQAAVADLSFRSMEGAAQRILELCADNELYALVKPQFERKYFLAGGPGDGAPGTGSSPGAKAFKGVVGAEETRAILEDLMRRLAVEGIALERIAPAGLKGRTGNQEYIALLRRDGAEAGVLTVRGQAAINRLLD